MGVKAIGEFHAWVNPNVPQSEIVVQLRAALKALESGDRLAQEGWIHGTDISHK